MRRIDSIGPSTIQPVVVSRTRLSDEEREAIAQALIRVADEPAARGALDAALVERFVPVSTGSYDDIRAMFRRVRGGGLLDASWDTRWKAITGVAAPGQPSAAASGSAAT